MISIVVTGRNDDYAGGFRERLFRTCRHNAARLAAAGVEHEFVLVEWNPVAGRPLLAQSFCETFRNARAFVVAPEVHRRHVTNPHMPFDEMAAKNAGLRRSRGAWTIAMNADIFFGSALVARLAGNEFREDTLYRAHRLDVPADTADADVATSVRRLSSGEGANPPCYYLGAGGDFCLAATSLWHRLTGFNQRVRFSTRAKDWQFFLSAASQGIDIEFIGQVFHLDHVGGFRNTPAAERSGAAAHFGGLWDIEFGLPLQADAAWGFPELGIRALGDRVDELCVPDSTEGPPAGDELEEYLAWPAGLPDRFSASAAHAVFAAAERGLPLLLPADTPLEAVAVDGMAAVGAAHGVTVRSDRRSPLPGLATAPWRDRSTPRAEGSWLALGRTADGFSLHENVSGPVDWLPSRIPLTDPPHNPMLGRRLLRAWLRLREQGARRLAIYGAGGHTEELLLWGIPDWFSVDAILVTGQASGSLCGIPVRTMSEVSPADYDAVLLSSIPYESEMAAAARDAGFGLVVPLWSDWPRTFWGNGPRT